MRLNGAMALNRPIHSKSVNIVCHFEEIVEKTPHQRWTLNQAFMKRQRAQRNAGG